MFVVLSGGVGAARFLQGLSAVVPHDRITAVVNTGDDYDFHGLRVSPDIDINIYTLAGAIHPEQGWGLADDTFNCLEALKRYGAPQAWFRVGDQDLGTHLMRTLALSQGQRLSQVTAAIAQAWGLAQRVLPMSDEPVATYIRTPAGMLHFQEYLVQRRATDEILGIELRGIAAAQPAPGVLEAIASAEVIIIPPSNPIVSVGPILAIPGVRDAIRAAKAPVIGVSPIVGGRTIKGPADKMLAALGMEISPIGVADAYGDLLDGLVIDEVDAGAAAALRRRGLGVIVTNTIMDAPERKASLARAVLDLAANRAGGAG